MRESARAPMVPLPPTEAEFDDKGNDYGEDDDVAAADDDAVATCMGASRRAFLTETDALRSTPGTDFHRHLSFCDTGGEQCDVEVLLGGIAALSKRECVRVHIIVARMALFAPQNRSPDNEQAVV